MNGFIEQTAQDYDLPYEVVEDIYEKYHSSGQFYEELELILKQQSQ